MIQLLINAVVIYALFSAFSVSPTGKKHENTNELAVLSVIGTSIVFLVILYLVGRIPALIGAMIWLFVSFHVIGKLSLKKSLIAAVCMFLVNMIIGVVFAKELHPQRVITRPNPYLSLPTSSPYHYTNAPDPLTKSFEDRLKKSSP